MPDQHPAKSMSTDFYDRRYAGDYMDKDAYTVWGHEDLKTQEVLDTLRAVPSHPISILDYGCGVGSWIELLSQVYPGSRITGVDVSRTAIAKATDRFPDCRFMTFDGDTAPLPDQEFDLIFSFHVLEHVVDFEASIRDIGRMLKHGGHAVIIFPCGNQGSLLDAAMSLFVDARRPTAEGGQVLAFEIPDGHVRRVTSRETIDRFGGHGLRPVEQYFSGHVFGTIDWLCRGTGPAYINRVFSGTPTGPLARLCADGLRRSLIGCHRLIQRGSLDMAKRRPLPRQAGALAVKTAARLTDRLIVALSALEWRFFRSRRNGSAQYLVLRKS